MAVVVGDANDASFYFNGNLVTGSATVGSFANHFSLGGDPTGDGRFSGKLDDVRVFTFAPGTFVPAMLSYTVVPEPSTYAALAGVLALGAVMLRRLRRR